MRDDVGVLFNGIDVSQREPAPPKTHRAARHSHRLATQHQKRVQDLWPFPTSRPACPAALAAIYRDRGRAVSRPARTPGRPTGNWCGTVEFLGYPVAALRSRRSLRRTDVFAPASTLEAFGLAVLEVRVARLPVVAMSGCGVSDIIEHGRHGLLADNRQQLAEHIALLV